MKELSASDPQLKRSFQAYLEAASENHHPVLSEHPKRPFSWQGSLKTGLGFLVSGPLLGGLAWLISGQPLALADIIALPGMLFILSGSVWGAVVFGFMSWDASGKLSWLWKFLVSKGVYRAGPENLLTGFRNAELAASDQKNPAYTQRTTIYANKDFMSQRPKSIQWFYFLHERIHVYFNSKKISFGAETLAYGGQALPLILLQIVGLGLVLNAAPGLGLATLLVIFAPAVLFTLSQTSRQEDPAKKQIKPSRISSIYAIIILLAAVNLADSQLFSFNATLDLLWQSYCERLSSHPLGTKAITAFGLGLTGDFMAQKIEKRRFSGDKKKINKRRLLSVSFLQMVLNGILLHFFFNILEWIVPGSDFSEVMLKTLIGSPTWAPLFHFLNFSGMIFFSKTGLREAFSGETFRECLGKFKAVFWSTYKKDFVLWTLIVSPLNFAFVPLDLRVLVVNLVAIPWIAYLSITGHRSNNEDESAKQSLPIRGSYWQEKLAAEDLKAAPEVLGFYDIGRIKPNGIYPTLEGLSRQGKPLIIETDKGKYVLKPITTALYPELEESTQYEVSVVKELVRQALPAAPIISTKKPGVYYAKASNGKNYVLYRFIEGKSVQSRDMNERQFDNFVDAIARINRALQSFKPAGRRTRPEIIDFHVQKAKLIELRERVLKKKRRDTNYQFSKSEKVYLEYVAFLLGQIDLLNSNLSRFAY
ncbi:Mpv17/PMP22 family protein, partial [bacterium]|nr:Mpv17/PMP22 family protein [bacterium]